MAAAPSVSNTRADRAGEVFRAWTAKDRATREATIDEQDMGEPRDYALEREFATVREQVRSYFSSSEN